MGQHDRISVKISDSGIYIAFLALFICFSVVGRSFFSLSNISNIIVQSSIIAIVGIGQTLVILSGGINLSVGSTVSFVGILTGLLLLSGTGIPLAVVIVLAVGGASGFLTGFVIAYGRVPSFIVTLGMMSILTGGTLLANNGNPVSRLPPDFEKLASLNVFGHIPIFVIYLILLFAGVHIMLKKTIFGRHIYALGGNRASAWLSGVKIKKTEILVYVLGGFFSAFGGIMLVARMNYASPTAASNYAIDSIAAVVIGGTAMSGGKGSILGTLLGAMLLGMLKNGLTMLNVSAYLQQVIIGAVIITAVFLDGRKAKD
jgi:ribose transport system permease protein